MFGWLLVTWAALFALRKASILGTVAVTILIAVGLHGIRLCHLLALEPANRSGLATAGFTGLSIGGSVLRWIEESRDREKLKKTFVQMVSPDLMNFLLEHPEKFEARRLETLRDDSFSDIRSFTTFSESTENEELVRQLNRYFDRMVRCILNYRGTLHASLVTASWRSGRRRYCQCGSGEGRAQRGQFRDGNAAQAGRFE